MIGTINKIYGNIKPGMHKVIDSYGEHTIIVTPDGRYVYVPGIKEVYNVKHAMF